MSAAAATVPALGAAAAGGYLPWLLVVIPVVFVIADCFHRAVERPALRLSARVLAAA